MNQELEQYLQFFIYHRQKNWLEWLATAEFAVNNKTYLLTKVSLFIANDRRENESGYKKKRKYRESNEVCRKDEKSIERSRGSIKKSTKGDKVIVLRTKNMDLVFFLIFLLILFYFIFNLFFCIFLFIELRVRISHVTQEERHRKY